jgi:exopolyphosphatase/guanosine-5'-triphosphate,3'-diphosphate pyrophosphatase
MTADAAKRTEAIHRARLADCLGLAARCSADVEHSHHVSRLALALFDETQDLHRLGIVQRRRLEYAAHLHDVGWKEGGQGHHKASLRIILRAREVLSDKRERRMVACIARYHRGSSPVERHRAYGKLSLRDRCVVDMLSAILRVADGLDRGHASLVENLRAAITPTRVTIRCTARAPAGEEREAALQKGDLFVAVFGRALAIECTHS